jgi:chemotaxis signal transduction protein
MPPGDAGAVVVWRLGDAVLAVELGAVDRIVPVGPDGRARTHEGSVRVYTPQGIEPARPPRQAVLLHAGPGGSRLAVAAEHVEGVFDPEDATAIAPPEWLVGLDSTQVRSLIRLVDQRLAVLLDVATLYRGQ